MHFQFINNNSELSDAAKRRIRVHAAKEKNLGRTVVRLSRKNVLSRSRELVSVFPLQVTLPRISSLPESEQDAAPTFARQVGDGLSVFSFAAELPQEHRELVHKAIYLFGRVHYIPELCNALEAHKGPPSMWFQLALEDEAYFHIFVAMSVVSLNSIRTEEDDPMLAICHLNKTFLLTNQRLSRSDAVSDASMAVVVMMAQYERQRERYIKGLTHIDGLQLMVKLRGGVSQLAKDKPSLCQKIIRLDLDYALYLGTATRFSIADVTEGCEIWSWFRDSFGKDYEHRTSSFDHLTSIATELQDLAVNITHLAWLLNDANAGSRPALNTRAFHGTVLLIGYRLIHFSPLGRSRPVCHLENAVHLGLVAFMMPFMYRFDGKVQDNPLLSRLIRLAVQQNLSADRTTQEILLWILLVGAASVFIQPLDDWIIPLISQMMHNLHLHTWEEASQAMSKYPWIEAYHNDPSQALFREQDLSDRFSAATKPGDGTVKPDLTTYRISS